MAYRVVVCKQETACGMRISDWSSDVCSSDLIIAPVRRGWRTLHDDTVFLEGSNILLKGSGKQLSEDHADIWMHAIYLQTTALPGDQPVINRADFLRGMGRNTSGASYERSEEHTSELQSLMRISYAVFCLKKKNNN